MDITQFEPGTRLALVTGAGHRLGKEIALKLASMGYAVAIHYHASNQLAAQTLETIQNNGKKAFAFQANLTDSSQIEDLFKWIDETHIPLHVLVNSASVMIKGGLNDFSVDDWDLTMDLNLRAVWQCSRLAGIRMQAEGGSIINISDSGAGKLWTGYPAYSISKVGVEILTRFMAKTLAPKIRVNAIAPGLILPPQDFPPEAWEKLVNKLPLKKAGQPEYICETIGFLLGNEYITGQTFVIDGGYQLV